MRRLLIIGASALLLILLTFYFIIVEPHALQPVVGKIRLTILHVVTNAISKSLHGSLEISAVKGSLLANPTLHHIVIRDADGTPIIQVDEVRISYKLLPLWHKRLVIEELSLIRPQFTLIQMPDRTLNINQLARATASTAVPKPITNRAGLPLGIELRSLQLHNGQLSLQLPYLAGVQTIDQIHVDLSGRIGSQTVQVAVHRFEAQVQPANISLRAIQGQFQRHGTSIYVKDLRIETDQTRINVAGAFPSHTQPADLSISLAPLDVAEVGRLVADNTLQGTINLSLTATGLFEAMQVETHLQAAAGTLDLTGQVNLSTGIPTYQATVDIDQFDVAAVVQHKALKSDLNLRINLNGTGITPDTLTAQFQTLILPSHLGNIMLRQSKVDIEIARKRIQVHTLNIDTSVANLTVDGVLDLAGSSDLHYELGAKLNDLKPLFGIQNLTGTLHLQGVLRGRWPDLTTLGKLKSEQIVYQANHIQSLGIHYQASQLGMQTHATAELFLQHAKIGTTPIDHIDLHMIYSDNNSERQVKFSTQARQSALYGVNLSGTLRLLDGKRQNLRLTECDIHLADRTWHAPSPITITVNHDHVQIHKFHMAHDNESITLSGGFTGTRLDDLHLQLSQFDLDFIRRYRALPPLIGSRLTLNATIAGTFDSPKLHATLQVRTPAHSLSHTSFDNLQLNLKYANHQLISTISLHQETRDTVKLNLTLPLDLALISMPISDRFKTDQLALKIKLNQLDLALLGRCLLPTFPPLKGSVKGVITLQGTYTQLALNTHLTLKQVGLGSSIDHLNAPLQLTGTIVLADSVSALYQTFSGSPLKAKLRNLTLRTPHLSSRLPRRSAPDNHLRVKNLLLQADGTWRPNSLDVTLHTLQLQAQGLGLQTTEITAAGRLTPTRILLSHLHTKWSHSEFHADGHLVLKDQAVVLNINIPRLNLAKFSPILLGALPSNVQGAMTLRGSLAAPEIKANFRYARALLTAHATAQLKDGRPRYTAEVNLAGLDISQFNKRLHGTISTHATLNGVGFTKSNRNAKLFVDITSDRFSLAPNLKAHIRATMHGTAMQLQALKLTSTPIDLHVKGSLSKSYIASLTYTATLDDFTPIRNYLSLDLNTVGKLTGTLTGPVNALRVQGTLELNHWRYTSFEGQRLRADITASGFPAKPAATLNAQIFSLKGSSVPESNLQFTGRYQDDHGTFNLTVTDGIFKQTSLVGTATIREDIQVTLKTLHIQRQDSLWSNPTPIQILRDAHGQLCIKHFRLRNGDEDIQLQAHLVPNGPVTGNIQINGLKMAPVFHAIAPYASSPNGQINLNVDISGTLQQPIVKGVIRIVALEWHDRKIGRVESKINLTNNTLENNFRWFDGNKELLHAFGSLGLGPNGKLAMQFKMDAFDLARLPSYSRVVLKSGGALDLDLHLSGTLRQPQAHGDLSLRDGRIHLSATGEPYTNVQTQLQFAGKRLTFHQFHIGSQTGTLNLSGWLQTDGLALHKLDIALKTKDFTAMNTSWIKAVLSTDLNIKGERQKLSIDGSITIPDATIRTKELIGGPAVVKPEELTVASVYGSGANAPTTQTKEIRKSQKFRPWPFLRANVTLNIPRNLWVSNKGVAIELRGQLHAHKQFSAPIILSGDMETVRGFATFYGKKFELQNGRITFTGSQEINPILDVIMAYKVAGYNVLIDVGGRIKKPTLTMRSEPIVPEQADIISLLLFRRTSDRLTASENSSLSNKAKNVAAGVVARSAAKALSKQVGLDSIEVQLGDDPSKARIGVGKYITQDIFLSFERQLGEEGGNMYGIEYSLNPSWMLKGTKSDFGETSLDVLWRLDY